MYLLCFVGVPTFPVQQKACIKSAIDGPILWFLQPGGVRTETLALVSYRKEACSSIWYKILSVQTVDISSLWELEIFLFFYKRYTKGGTTQKFYVNML